MSIAIVPYNPAWIKQFEIEASILKKILSDNCLSIHHIGSTSIPNLAAKPIIDILSVVQDISLIEQKIPQLTALSYEAKGEYGIPFRRYFRKGNSLRTHHIHIFEHGNPEIERYLKFREWLRQHPEDKNRYENLKKFLWQEFSNDSAIYASKKNEFISQIVFKAG